MIKKLFRRKFEQSSHPDLPHKASRILQAVANDFMASDRSAKHHEMARANLHMRLYQHFGHESSQIVPHAEKLLGELLGPKATV